MEQAKKLCLENIYIMKENERLRKQKQILNEEYQVLLAELKQLRLKKQGASSNPNFNTTTTTGADLSGAQGNANNGA